MTHATLNETMRVAIQVLGGLVAGWFIGVWIGLPVILFIYLI